MFYHLVEVATSWEVVVKGHGDDAMPVASAKDSIEAAKVLFAYDMGKPVESMEVKDVGSSKVMIYLPANGRDPEKDRAETDAETSGDG